MKNRRYTTEEERKNIVRKFYASGKTRVSFCENNDVSYESLKRWISAYGKDIKKEGGTDILSERTVVITVDEYNELLEKKRKFEAISSIIEL